jgi:uncharacterized protein (TIGR00730 family)
MSKDQHVEHHRPSDQIDTQHFIRDLSEQQRMRRIYEDFKRGFDVLQETTNTVTFFGSARFTENHHYYKVARQLSARLADELDIATVTGGGPGIMEAGNRGAKEAGGVSVGMTIQLPHEQVTNPYLTDTANFYYFFSRKVSLAFGARAFVLFPGGFGTLDEFFEIITLMQTKKIPTVPVVLIGQDFWEPLLEFINTKLKDEFSTIDDHDTNLYTLTDDLDVAVNIIAAGRGNGNNSTSST